MIAPFVADYLAALQTAERPLILVGGGARKVIGGLHSFAEMAQIPMVPTWNALDLVPRDLPMFGGTIGTYGCGVGRNFAVQQADVVLSVGCRMSGRLSGGREKDFLRGAKRIFAVDIDRGVLDNLAPVRHSPGRVSTLCADASAFVAQLTARDFTWRDRYDIPARPQWLTEVFTWRDRYDAGANAQKPVAEGLNPYAFVRALSDAAPSNAIITSECGGNAVIMHQAFRVKTGQRFFSSHGNSPMGGGLSYGIGAALAAPDRPVICVVGDAGLAASAHELLSLHVHGRKLKNLRVFVLNNHCMGITRAYQATNLEGRFVACGPDRESGYETPDFGELCDAYQVRAGWIANPATMLEAVASWFDADGPVVVDVDCGDWQDYSPRIAGFDRPIEEATPSLPPEEFLAQMKYIEPLPGWRERRG